jgi:predicted SnoaL-like aldol condensation-catalyzing enzyme
MDTQPGTTAHDTKSFVIQAVSELTTTPDTMAALRRYYSPQFVQHSPLCGDGWEGLQQLTDKAKSGGAQYELLRAFGADNMAVLHARVTGLAEVPLILFNLYRVEDGLIAEHWEGVGPETDAGMTAGTTEASDLGGTARNKELVRQLIEEVLIPGDRAALNNYLDDGLVRHAAAADDDGELEYLKLHRILAEGDFVFTLSEGAVARTPHSIHNLFRVDRGKVVELWEIRAPVPKRLPHDNGLF